ncbi:PR domain zinc finger protein 10-like [Paramacrobiotus metropolitanus]|uniref:PR domain zinc finger protein 10-like n=1 Tax=Paramacrobiotus metropolitanus TaxID=2943436 RepID=UPI00244657F0|nr:PR domain zinc finger protein 10-like [Paramacrobiotus metropolitanus]
MQRLLPKDPRADGKNGGSSQPPASIPSVGLPTFILVPIAPVLHSEERSNVLAEVAGKKRRCQTEVGNGRTKLARRDPSEGGASSGADENCSDPKQCRRCEDGNDEPCVLHSRLISDTPTVARAYGSLPSELYIAQKEGMLDPGVFAKRAIPHPSVFGPLLAPLTPHPVATFLVDHRFGLREKKGSRGENAFVRVFDLKSDDLCNWIKFVREAVDAEQQNLVAFQQDDHVYLATTKHIPAETELCFWYSTKYCRLLNKENLSPESFIAELSENCENEAELSSRLENPAPAVVDELVPSPSAETEGVSVNDENTGCRPLAAASTAVIQFPPLLQHWDWSAATSRNCPSAEIVRVQIG